MTRSGLSPASRAAAFASLGWDGCACSFAHTFSQRLFGLMGPRGKRAYRAGAALLFDGCDAVHTCFMLVELDIAFIDAQGCVLKLHERVAPWRFVRHRGAAAVIERPRVSA